MTILMPYFIPPEIKSNTMERGLKRTPLLSGKAELFSALP